MLKVLSTYYQSHVRAVQTNKELIRAVKCHESCQLQGTMHIPRKRLWRKENAKQILTHSRRECLIASISPLRSVPWSPSTDPIEKIHLFHVKFPSSLWVCTIQRKINKWMNEWIIWIILNCKRCRDFRLIDWYVYGLFQSMIEQNKI